MDALTKYVFFNYMDLMSRRESSAYMSIVGEEKAKHASSLTMKERLRRELVSKDPEVLQLLAVGAEQFFTNTSEGVLREHRREIFLNRCPHCGRLARTPRAKQYRHCFFSWHE